MKKVIAFGLAAGLGLGTAALASDQPGTAANQWVEEATNGTDFAGRPDSSTMPGDGLNNITRGAGPLEIINGSQFTPHEYDVYQISISDEANFSASVGGYTNGNPNFFLTLFDSSGSAVAFNNDFAALSLSSAHVDANGLYYLAVGGRTQMYATQFGEFLFDFAQPAGEHAAVATASGESMPTQLVATSLPSRFTGNRAYTISLTGAGYATVPTPGALALVGLGGLVAMRRRR